MRRIISILLLAFSVSLFANNKNEEFRAIWVVTWDHISSSLSTEQNKANVRKIMDEIKSANMNAVLWQVRQSGTAYYNSSYEPWGYYAGYSDPGYDPLAYAIQEAHKRGLELHAWFNTFQVSSTHSGTVADLHPEWICTNQDDQYMTSHRSDSPGLQEVRDYTLNVAMEIVNNYDIDGLHLDYIRWNEYDEDDMINPPSIERQESALDGQFSQKKIMSLGKTAGSKRYIFDKKHKYANGVPAGYTSWDDWRRDGVTKFVHALHDSIQKVKPWVRLSPAALGKYKAGGTSGWNGYYIVFQDAAKWFNEGYVDQLTPMHYHWLNGNDMKDELTSDWLPNIGAGISAGRLYSNGPGSYLLDDYGVWNNHEDIVAKVRTLDWVDGFQFFSYSSWEGHKYWVPASEKFFLQKTKIRGGGFISTQVPDAPGLTLIKTDSLTYQLEVTPPAGLDSSMWFAVYRSEDDQLNTDSDEILDIHFTDAAYSLNQSFSGEQDFNGQYTYFATAFNRYWNESLPSESHSTDSIPSAAPMVTDTYPAAGVLLSINDHIKLTFSKTIDTEAAAGAFSFDPAFDFAIAWSNKSKTVTLTPVSNLAMDTEYTLTVSTDLKDVNGRAIDGNGDGTEGDAYEFTFRTKAKDDVPPEIVWTNPDYHDWNAKLDVADLVSARFNEVLEDSTVNEENISFYRSSNKIPSKVFHKTMDDVSIVSVQPVEELKPSIDYTVQFGNAVADTAGNPMGVNFVVSFRTKQDHYTEETMIEDFWLPAGWWQPNGSGSTTGIIESQTSWGYTTGYYLPAEDSKHKAARLSYSWDPDAIGGYLLREYFPPNDSKNVEFDSSYVLQVYLYGDGSGNSFRFCVDENDGSSWVQTEVSNWITIDWQGWKLLEWDFMNPDEVGSWLGTDEQCTGPTYRIDSFQFTHDSTGAMSGKVYLDNLRLVKKSSEPVGIANANGNVPTQFTVGQNYPNPFNPVTTIPFYLPHRSKISVTLYNVLGEKTELVKNQLFAAGRHALRFDGSHLASGVYVYEVAAGKQRIRRKMTLLK